MAHEQQYSADLDAVVADGYEGARPPTRRTGERVNVLGPSAGDPPV